MSASATESRQCGCSSHIAQATEGKGRDRKNEPPTVGEDQVQDQLRKLKVHTN